MMYGGEQHTSAEGLRILDSCSKLQAKGILWEREGEKEILRTIAVEGRPGIGFEIERHT